MVNELKQNIVHFGHGAALVMHKLVADDEFLEIFSVCHVCSLISPRSCSRSTLAPSATLIFRSTPSCGARTLSSIFMVFEYQERLCLCHQITLLYRMARTCPGIGAVTIPEVVPGCAPPKSRDALPLVHTSKTMVLPFTWTHRSLPRVSIIRRP